MAFGIRFAIRQFWKYTGRKDMQRMAAQTPPPQVMAKTGLAYLPGGNRMHQLNLYWPQGATGPLPTIVNIHGGGWVYGDRNLNQNYCMHLAAQGFAVMGMSYRLLYDTDLRGMVQDVFASMHWLQAHGAEYHFDMQQLFICGDSAGGHLTGLATCIQLSPELQQIYGVQPLAHAPGAIGILHGVCDVTRFGDPKSPISAPVRRELHAMMFGKAGKQAPWYGKASFAETAPGLPLPPVMLISSEADTFHTESLALESYLAGTGTTCETLFWPLATHPQLGHVFEVSSPDLPESEETNLAMLRFFRRHLRQGQ